MNWYLNKSNIHGVGIFNSKYLLKNEMIDIVINNYNITDFGSKINHSFTPNCRLVQNKNIYYLVANQNINPNTELTSDYNKGPFFVKKADPNWS